MVGVAGKSKGCNTCRKRKIACDQKRPICTQCTRSGRICAGYERDRVFVLVEPASKKTHTFIRPGPSSPRSCSGTPDYTPQIQMPLNPSSSATRFMVGSTEPIHCFPETSAACAVINSSFERHSLIQAFLSRCFFGRWEPQAIRSWLPLLSELPDKADFDPLRQSSLALATLILGRDSQDYSLVHLSLKCYTRGLHQLRKALRHPSLMKEDGTLAACMALSLYETIECPSQGSGGYFSHCHGLLAMIQARGVERHTSGPGHRLFLGIRVPGILYALSQSTPIALSEPPWMEAPWSKLPKTNLDQVTDCLMAAPGILQRVPLLAYLSLDHQLELILELVSECWQIDQKLDLIDNEIQHAASSRCYNINSSHSTPLADHDSRNQIFLSDFDFEDSTIARTLILLWATRTTLWSGLCSLYRHYEGLKEIYHSNSASNDITNSRKHNESMKSLPELGYREDYLSMAHNVCQSLPYFLQNEMGIIGVLSVTPAIGLVIDALRNWPGHAQELQWLQESLDSIQEKGVRVLEYSRSQT